MSFKKFSQFKPINKDISHRQAKALYNNMKGGADKNMIEIEYEDLVALRDEAKLIPGCYYRIIDYVTTTSQDFTHSLGHPFDVVVLALSPYTLDENAKAMHSDRDNYFDNFNLESWKLKYSLTNDNNKFAWGNDVTVDVKKIDVSESNLDISSFNLSTGYGTQTGDVYILTDVDLSTNNTKKSDDHPTDKYYILDTAIFVGDKIYFYTYDGTNYTISKNYFVVEETYDENGDVAHFQKNKGVIYELIDELNNRAGFDHYNISTDITLYLEAVTARTVVPAIKNMNEVHLFNFEDGISKNNFIGDCYHFNSSFGITTYSIPYGRIAGKNNIMQLDDDVYNVFAIRGDNNNINCNNNFIEGNNLTIAREHTLDYTIISTIDNILNCANPVGNWCIRNGALYQIPDEELFQSMFTD